MTKTVTEVLAELEQFNHKSAAAILRKHIKVECTCSSMSHKTDYRCELHPDARVRTLDQRFDFEHAFDARIDAQKNKED